MIKEGNLDLKTIGKMWRLWIFFFQLSYYYRLQGKVMFSQASVILSAIGLMTTRSLLVLVTACSVRILLECFLVSRQGLI